MSNYRSEYEEYYKNINNKSNNNQKLRYLPISKKGGNHIYDVGRNDEQVKYFSKDYWIKRLIMELSGSLILLTIFMGLKYIKNDYVQRAYILSKAVITSSFNYDATIEAFNNYKFGTLKIKEINIGSFTVEDLKSDKISIRINSFIEYLKNSMNTQRIEYIFITRSAII
ncbi:MAG: hypothetical protein E7207_06235 [Clostridium butyricum]|nr:hypothetical protein [Clostridium butyricum]